jgi:hypothetical protein
MADVVEEVMTAIWQRDFERLRPLLHPYLHWRRGGGDTLRGRSRVMAWLAEGPPPRSPESYELRDGKIYRWREQS